MQTTGEAATPSADLPHWTKFYVDGGLIMSPRNKQKIVGIYWSMRCEEPEKIPVVLRRRLRETHTNNDAEWLALREALTYAAEHFTTGQIVIYSDSQLVVSQFNGVWRAKIARHHRWRDECRALAQRIKFVAVEWRPRTVMVQKLGH